MTSAPELLERYDHLFANVARRGGTADLNRGRVDLGPAAGERRVLSRPSTSSAVTHRRAALRPHARDQGAAGARRRAATALRRSVTGAIHRRPRTAQLSAPTSSTPCGSTTHDLDLIAELPGLKSSPTTPISNLRLGSGVMPFRAIRTTSAASPIALGVDEAICNDAADMWNVVQDGTGLIHNISGADSAEWPTG